ncbi:MAG: hypothetical protein IJ688_07365 [Treponema sp.]|nr:hypothetical protein [Treponema sp.]
MKRMFFKIIFVLGILCFTSCAGNLEEKRDIRLTISENLFAGVPRLADSDSLTLTLSLYNADREEKIDDKTVEWKGKNETVVFEGISLGTLIYIYGEITDFNNKVLYNGSSETKKVEEDVVISLKLTAVKVNDEEIEPVDPSPVEEKEEDEKAVDVSGIISFEDATLIQYIESDIDISAGESLTVNTPVTFTAKNKDGNEIPADEVKWTIKVLYKEKDINSLTDAVYYTVNQNQLTISSLPSYEFAYTIYVDASYKKSILNKMIENVSVENYYEMDLTDAGDSLDQKMLEFSNDVTTDITLKIVGTTSENYDRVFSALCNNYTKSYNIKLDCSELTTSVSEKSLSWESTFINAEFLTDIILPADLTKITFASENGCTNLKTLKFTNEDTAGWIFTPSDGGETREIDVSDSELNVKYLLGLDGLDEALSWKNGTLSYGN